MAGAFLISLQREPVVCHAVSNCAVGEQEEAADEGSSQAWDGGWIAGGRGDGQVLLHTLITLAGQGGCKHTSSGGGRGG